MSLHTGQYRIVSRESGLSLGRGLEDKSLRPKKISTLPPGVPKFTDVFDVTKIDERKGIYRITCGGSVVGSKDRKVYAFLLETPEKEDDWYITRVPNQGQNTYIIKSNQHLNLGWVSRGLEGFEQVELAPLIVMPTFPPRYPAFELFEFVPADEDANESDYSDSE